MGSQQRRQRCPHHTPAPLPHRQSTPHLYPLKRPRTPLLMSVLHAPPSHGSHFCGPRQLPFVWRRAGSGPARPLPSFVPSYTHARAMRFPRIIALGPSRGHSAPRRLCDVPALSSATSFRGRTLRGGPGRLSGPGTPTAMTRIICRPFPPPDSMPPY